MARPSGVWRRKTDGWWMTTVKGKQYRVIEGGTKTEARAELVKLLATLPDSEKLQTGEPQQLFSRLADDFLARSQRQNKPRTYQRHRVFLQSFHAFVGAKRVPQLRPSDVESWLHAHPAWNPSSQRTAVATVLACLNWGVHDRRLAANPLAFVRKPRGRARDRILLPAELDRVHGAITGTPFAAFFSFLELTGCRPFSEGAKVAAAMLDRERRTITLREHKNARRGKTRTIYCSDPTWELVSRQAEAHPEGPLFRNSYGRPWNQQSVCNQLKDITVRLGMPRFCAYALRHTYITAALAKGVTLGVVAELVGCSPTTIANHYDHLNQKLDVMREAAQRAMG